MLLAACHTQSSGWANVERLEELSDLRAEAGNLLWAESDVSSLTDEDVALIAEEFELPELAVEDAVKARQRPKLELYGDVIFIVTHQLDEIDDQLEACQIAFFIGDRYVLTLHHGADRTLTEAKKRWERTPPEHSHPALLLHTLLDVVVDDYQEIADRLESEVEELEDIVLALPQAPVQRQIYTHKQQISRLRRYVIPGQRLMEWAVNPSNLDKPFSEETGHLYRDVNDHLLRIVDQVRNVEDLTQAVLDMSRSAQVERLNEINKQLSAWAAIFGVDTLIAGIYGMNFILVPEDQTLYGFWFAIGLIVVSSLFLFLYFRRRKWL